MQDIDELATHSRLPGGSFDEDDDNNEVDGEEAAETKKQLWEPSGSWWKDFLYFSGPGMGMLL